MAVAATWVVAWFAVAPVLSAADAPADEEQKLLEVLKSEAPLFDKAKACQRLAVVGSKACVPVLADLLGDESLAHYARFGLEPIPDPAVDDALRAALGKLDGELRVGVINSIGVRRDAKALDALQKLLDGADGSAAGAAAASIARIGTSTSARVLTAALTKGDAAMRSSVADACLPCAEILLAKGQKAEAVALYDAVREADIPSHIRLAALRGAIVARGTDGASLLVESIAKGDPSVSNLALLVSREVKDPTTTRALVDALGKLSAEKQSLVLLALGDRGDKTALPAVLKSAKSGPEAVRVAAIRALQGLEDPAAVPVLLDAAARGDGAVAEAAQTTLAALQAREVDEAIVDLLEDGDKDLRVVLLELIGQRRITSAVPALRKAADEEGSAVRLAAIKALGQTIGLSGVPVLTARVVKPGSPEEVDAVLAALRSACRRMPDRDACAEKLVESMEDASVEAQCRLLDVFSSLGGEKALKSVAANAQSANATIRAAALKVLGEWPSEDAARELLAIVRSYDDAQDRIQAMRSFSSVIQRIGFPKEERLGLCEQGMELCKSVDERKLVIDALAGVPAPETLTILGRYLADAALKEYSSEAMVKIGERLVRTKRDAVRPAMQQVIDSDPGDELLQRAKAVLRQAGG